LDPDGAVSGFVLFDFGEGAGVGVDGVCAEAGVALAGDVEVFAGGIDGEGAGDAFAGVVADEGEVAGVGVDLETDDGVPAGVRRAGAKECSRGWRL
jgi:hypothetical protein